MSVSGLHTGPSRRGGGAGTRPARGDGGWGRATDFHEHRDGRVWRLRIVFDMVDVGRQLGTLPKAGSPVERAGASAQRLAMSVQERLRR
jgi:hypothetical protein